MGQYGNSLCLVIMLVTSIIKRIFGGVSKLGSHLWTEKCILKRSLNYSHSENLIVTFVLSI